MEPLTDKLLDEELANHPDIRDCLKGGMNASKNERDDLGCMERVPDWSTRHKFLVTKCEMLGLLKGAVSDVNVTIKNEAQRRINEAMTIEYCGNN